MKTLPFIIKKFALIDKPSTEEGQPPSPDDELVELVDDIQQATSKQTYDTPIPGYFVMSSATPNVDGGDDDETSVPKSVSREASHRQDAAALQSRQQEVDNAARGITEIAEYLYRIYAERKTSPELVIVVHGYNMSRSSVCSWYKDIFYYINRYDAAIATQRNQVFIGYRWPSENVRSNRLFESLTALPPLPRDLLIMGAIAALVLLVLELLELFIIKNFLLAFFLGIPLFLLMLLGFMMLTLVMLRLVVYFRDRYRASNFGVLDLVELLRQIDWALVQIKANELRSQHGHLSEAAATEESIKHWRQETRRVKLSFIGHSMGGFVVTSAVRILSDVFDFRSVLQQPPADVGSVFRLERLLLASPDIPILTIISNRANFLASSLRRFAESYLLSNEGDIALRMASTTANYIAFPSRTQYQGYRLGNVALKGEQYGIVNLNALDNELIEGRPLKESIVTASEKILENLFVTAERFKPGRYVTLAELFRDQAGLGDNRVTVADFFTFFDCTDYKDVEFSVRQPDKIGQRKGILTRAKRKRALTAGDYFQLAYDYITRRRDVHGGYFQGEFTQTLLYRTAFLGFTGYLKTLDDDLQNAYDPHVALSKFHMACREKGIQGFLSPIRYRVDIQKQSLADTIQELLQAITPTPVNKVEDSEDSQCET
ncbi:MAG: alpha/beta hydrolase [Elainellaceae cyanobacterium]